jgi:trypsin
MTSILDYDNQAMATVTQINATKVPTVYHCNKNNVSCGCGYTDVEITQSRIMNGENAIEASWSMFVSLRTLNSSQHICGGTLLSNLYVLTAAHCVQSFSLVNPSDLTIVAGITNQLDPDRHIRHVHLIYIHPNFTNQSNTFVNDIAILELGYRLLIDSNPVLTRTCVPSINSSILNNQYPLNGTQLVVIGWGTTEHEQYVEPDILQQTEVVAIDNNYPICSNLINDVRKQFCAGIYQERKG